MKLMTLVTAAAISLTLIACSKLNKDNYEQLKMGMQYSEVTDIIGAANDCSETLGTKYCTWGDDVKNIKVTFVADKAITFSNNGMQ